MQASPFPVSPGEILAGKYRIERVLGVGGMGVVVAARHLDLGELFALKFLLPQAVTNAQAVERFLREARASARLKGEHVAKVTDVGRLENGAPYIVMEYLQGNDLQKHVRTGGPLSAELAVTYMLQVCDAIAEAHGLGMVHRDLKPANLFLTTRPNGTPCVKVLDFGISKQITPDAVDLTKTGNVLGSPLYMAPEQMARTKDADARSDIWSMGIVFYELLTGTVPFFADTITEVVARVLQEEAVPPSQVRPNISPALDAIVAKCLEKRPAQRFQSILELAAALRAVAHPHEARAPQVQDARQSRPQDHRPSLPGADSGSGTLVLDSSVARSLAPPQPAGPAQASTASAWGTGGSTGGSAAAAPQPRKSSVGGLIAAGAVLVVALVGTGGYFALRSSGEGSGTAANGGVGTASEGATSTSPAVQPDPGLPSSANAAPSVKPADTDAPVAPTVSATPAATTSPPKPTATAPAGTVRPTATVAQAAATASPVVTAPAGAPTGTGGKKKRDGVW